MLITINILSAMSIVMALFIPYFILLHLNNKLRKEVEGALNRVMELKVYSKMIDERLIQFIEVSNVNFDSQDKNWENQNNISKSFRESFLIADRNFKAYDENFENIVNEIENLYELVNQKTALKEILETPIEVKKPACETKVGLWSMGEVNSNKIDFTEIDLSTIDEHILPSTFSNIENVNSFSNKKNFRCDGFGFKKDDIIKVEDGVLSVERYGSIFISYHLVSLSGKNLFKKILQINAPKRKYIKRTIKNEN